MTFRFFLFGSILISFFFVLNACQSQQNVYKKAYEPARSLFVMKKEKNLSNSPSVIDEKSATNQPLFNSNNCIRTDKIFSMEGNEKISLYSVVIGSFVNKVNAESLKGKMEEKGYHTILTKNEKGMYRVIIGTFDRKDEAIEKCEKMKRKFAREFDDVWILKQADY